VLSGAQVVALLKQHGFSEVRQRGSHLALQRPLGSTTVTVIVPLHRELRAGTLASIARQSKLDRSIFEVGES
jgi:predicted RNA binding protein YcfA (HicA-like mRNA interferase family)